MIDYRNLSKSKIFYNKNEILNFSYIEVPWYIPNFYTDVLKPSTGTDFRVNDNSSSLLSSGEQALFYLYSKGLLEPYKSYQTITPCFRDDNEDLLHNKQFMKNELFISIDSYENEKILQNVISCAESFFKAIGLNNLERKATDEGIDIVNSQGDELGSYGIRKIQHLKYIYGTGCAEPRTSFLIQKQLNGLS